LFITRRDHFGIDIFAKEKNIRLSPSRYPIQVKFPTIVKKSNISI